MSVGIIKRVVPLDEVRANRFYDDMADLAVIFSHDIVEMDDGKWRWRPNSLIGLLFDGRMPFIEGPCHIAKPRVIRGKVDLNSLWRDFGSRQFTVEELAKLYMQSGYSLCGFAEIFGQSEAADWHLPGAKAPDHNGEHYTQTPIMYLTEKYAGQVLKL